MSLPVPSRNVSDVVILDVPHKFWLHSVRLRDHIRGMLNNGVRAFVLNLENVDYVDSMAIGQLVSVWTIARDNGARVTLLKPSRRVQIALQLTRLDDVFQVFDDEAEAVSGSRESGPARPGDSLSS